MSRSLVVKVTCGSDDAERSNQGFTVAAAAAAAGASVSLWLTGESVWLAGPRREEGLALPHATPVADLLSVVLTTGTVTVCSQCAVRRGLTQDDFVAGIRIAGAAVFAEEILFPDVQAIVY